MAGVNPAEAGKGPAEGPIWRNMPPAVWDETGHPERGRISEDLFTLLFTPTLFFSR